MVHSKLRWSHRPSRWLGVRPQVDLEARPVRIDLRPSPAALVLGVVFGVLWLLLSMQLVFQVPASSPPALALALLFPAIGVAIIAGSVVHVLRRQSVTFEADGVSVKARGLRGGESWRLPYNAFAGVLHREHTVRGKNSSTTYQIIELYHPDPKRCVPLYVKTSTRTPRSLWENYARALDLPALEEETSGVIKVRDAADLDKSIKDLAAEGRVGHAYDPNEPPPAGLRLWQDGDGAGEVLRVAITRGRMPLWVIALFAAPQLFFLLAGLVRPDSWPLALFGGLLFAAVLAIVTKDLRSRRELQVSRKKIRQVDPWSWDRDSRRTLRLAEIESIRMRRARSNMGNELVLESDRGHMAVGLGLSKPALLWLERFLTAAIATS